MDQAGKQLTALCALDVFALLVLALVVVWQQSQGPACATLAAPSPAAPGFESLAGPASGAACLRIPLR